MYSRIFFLLVIVCAVNASVYTVNAYDDNPETEIASSLKGCNPQECDQRCRRLKFPGGACVNGRCKCDNFLNVKDDVSEEEPAIFKDLASLEDDSEAEPAANLRRCRDGVCDAVCRVVHDTSGACVDGHCKCTNKTLVAEGDEPKVTSLQKSCNPQECDQRCRRLKFPGGACVNGRCKCDNFFNARDKFMTDLAETLRSCNPITCDEQCRRKGHEFGKCFKGECKCDYFLNSEDTMTDLAESLRSCNPITCDEQCRRKGHEFGRCFKGECKCDFFLNSEDASPVNDVTDDENEVSNDILRAVAEEQTDVSPRACDSAACYRACRSFNFVGGWCRFGRCQCF